MDMVRSTISDWAVKLPLQKASSFIDHISTLVLKNWPGSGGQTWNTGGWFRMTEHFGRQRVNKYVLSTAL